MGRFYFSEAGRRLNFEQALGPHAKNTPVYICGPSRFMAAAVAAARALGWAEHTLHTEAFSAGDEPSTTGNAFCIYLARSGRTLKVPCDKTVLEVLRDAGLPIDSSCEQGVCGTCEVKVLQGQPDHRDSYYTAQERDGADRLLACCSRARSGTLVVDL